MTTLKYLMLQVFLLSATAMFSADASAEGNCPPGYYPTGGDQAGWHGCAPMNGGIGDESEDNEPEASQAAQEVWEDRWGAIATANGAMGQAVSKKTKDEAIEEALKDCRDRAGKESCKLKVAYYSQCVALAWGASGNVAARGPDLREVEERAVEKCSNDFRNCKIYYSACSLPVRVR